MDIVGSCLAAIYCFCLRVLEHSTLQSAHLPPSLDGIYSIEAVSLLLSLNPLVWNLVCLVDTCCMMMWNSVQMITHSPMMITKIIIVL